jgi:hypothetical protein
MQARQIILGVGIAEIRCGKLEQLEGPLRIGGYVAVWR